ncbi:zinc ribbon domain-containing protein [Paraburkholderia sp. J41]|uniref:zinc ribbon domain-containing protein n=1 Tax=Paraburkholderia sp. J41 TaxID=2805433 RepID=UPI002AC34561|nr:zinc ribbon domain-containing protein [Paraburkholderia sp. J41]
MPLYDYDCPSCGIFEASRRIAERDAALRCPACGALAQRHINTKAASVGGSESGNEDPGSYGMRHRGGCSCC